MNKKTLIIGAVIVALGTAAVGTASFASREGDSSDCYGQRMGGWGHHGGKHGGFMGGGHRGGMKGKMMQTLDGNADGQLSQDEINAAIAERVGRFDADGDGALSLDEFEALWSDFMRERMVDHFQELDADGNATVTLGEFQDPFSQMVERFDRNGDGVLSMEDRRKGHRGHHREDDDD